jgi:two-component system nitrogen regulation response regulator GlnG
MTLDLRRTQVSTALSVLGSLTRVDTSTYRLVVETAPGKTESRDIPLAGALTVGRDSSCDFVVPHETVSGRHASFSIRERKSEKGKGNAVVVRDHGSTNGTRYENATVIDAEIEMVPPATLMLGDVRVKIVPRETDAQVTPSRQARFGALVGEDPRIRQMFSLLADVAPTDATVVIEGETGTGKELVARALHDESARAKKPFVVFDCSAVASELIESHLFGHIKGAFTGATATRHGAFKRAHGGTIFLDEIGELPLDLQPKLLRAIESRTVQMVGGDEYERVDVRVIAATNRNLKSEVRAGRFREDLYYRLAVVRIVLPPLRERTDDIETLVGHFITKAAAVGGAALVIDKASFAALKAYPWPGNVRELKNLVERATSLYRGTEPVDLSKYLPGASEMAGLGHDEVTRPFDDVAAGSPPSDVQAALARALAPDDRINFKDAKNIVVEAFERSYFATLLNDTDGNISRASQVAQMDRKHLRELLKKHGLWEGET